MVLRGAPRLHPQRGVFIRARFCTGLCPGRLGLRFECAVPGMRRFPTHRPRSAPCAEPPWPFCVPRLRLTDCQARRRSTGPHAGSRGALLAGARPTSAQWMRLLLLCSPALKQQVFSQAFIFGRDGTVASDSCRVIWSSSPDDSLGHTVTTRPQPHDTATSVSLLPS